MDAQTVRKRLQELTKLKEDHEDLQRIIRSYDDEITELKQKLRTAEADAQGAKEDGINLFANNEALKVEKKALEERARAATDYVLDVGAEIKQLKVENEALRARQRTEKEDSLVYRLVASLQRLAAHIMGSQGFQAGIQVKNAEDVEHLLEAVEHAMDDWGVPKL